MAKIEKFEDIKAWQIARQINKKVYQATNTGQFAKDFSLKDQIRRASISVSLNIAAGFVRASHKEFNNFCLSPEALQPKCRRHRI